ncbi:MAG: exodeoxyribonuclease-3 [Saprospiraceae bacterium]|jgi:exodeoxyribonuclease-3
MTSILSYNVNGIRAAVNKGFLDFLKEKDIDIVCVQEIKAMKEQAPLALIEELGYHHNWHSAEKKGYSGVAIFSKKAPDKVVVGCGLEKYDREGRIIRADFGDVSILNCYFPSGTTGDIRQDFKYEFLADFFDWIKELKKTRKKLIIVGDYNIAHTEMDIHNPKGNKKNSGFLPEEREWMTKWLASGFTDAYRHLNPEKVEYSWWSYRSNARANNKGWRIDYQSVTDNLKDQLVESYHLTEGMHSDHCGVYLDIDI